MTPTNHDERQYQLTHDYLVRSVRDWLNEGRIATRRGRAEIRLAERTALWHAKQETRHLPAWWESLLIRFYTKKRDWTPEQRKMMRRAARHHAAWGLGIAVVMVALGFAGYEYLAGRDAKALCVRFLGATNEEVPTVLKLIEDNRRRVEPLLREARLKAEADHDNRKMLLVSLALAPTDDSQQDYLYSLMLSASPADFLLIRDALRRHSEALLSPLYKELENTSNHTDRRLRAAGALVEYSPDHGRVAEHIALIVGRLVKNVTDSPQVLGDWKKGFEKAVVSLQPALSAALEAETWTDAERRSIVKLYAAIAENEPDKMALLETRLAELDGPREAWETPAQRGRRQGSVAAALVAMGQPEKVWPRLVYSEDLTARSCLIERLGGMLTDYDRLTPRFQEETNISARIALILAIGTIDPEPLAEKKELTDTLRSLYLHHRDRGIHSAVDWVLRRWGHAEELQEIDKQLSSRDPVANRDWYVNRQGQTFVVMAKGTESWVGEDKSLRRGRLDRDIAVGIKEVTVGEFRRLCDYQPEKLHPDDFPAVYVSWYQAAEYCNLLSAAEYIPERQWCYAPNSAGKYAEGMRIRPNWKNLEGYRLPTREEWEFLARAGAKTLWSCGQVDSKLLPAYARYRDNAYIGAEPAPSPVGSYKPNEFGVFDAHGNAWEYVQDAAALKKADYGADYRINAAFRQYIQLFVTDKVDRRIVGGSFQRGLALNFVSAVDTLSWGPARGDGSMGLRAVRSLPKPNEDQK